MADGSSGKLRAEALSEIGYRDDYATTRRNVTQTTKAGDDEVRSSMPTSLQRCRM